MKNTIRLILVVTGLLLLCAPVAPTGAQTQPRPAAQVPPMPQPGVPEVFTMEGKFVRAAYNNEGYVILGYQPANRSIGEDWMLLEIGVTVRDRVPDFKLTRDALSLRHLTARRFPWRRSPSSGREHPRAAESGEGPARLDQLLSAEREPGVPHRLLLRSGLSARCRGTRSR